MRVTEECINGCLSGEQTAQKELYEEMMPYLNALCGRYLNDTSARQDILQESFVVIFKKIDLFDAKKGAFHSWAGKIVINNCLKQNKLGLRFFQFQSSKHELAMEPEVIGQLSNEDLIRFLKTMPQKYYEVFVLFVVDDFSHEEISEMLGIKIELSRKRLARARAWIRNKPKSLEMLFGDYRYKIG